MAEHERIIDLAARRRKTIVDQIRIHHDEFEYRLLPDYAEKIDLVKTECIQLDDCFVQVTKKQGHYILLSILLEKEAHTIDSVVHWVETHQVQLFPKDVETIILSHAEEVIDALRFFGQPIVLYKPGAKTLTLKSEDLEEITEVYKQHSIISNTADYEPVLDHHDKDRFGLTGSDYQFDDYDKDDMLWEIIRGLKERTDHEMSFFSGLSQVPLSMVSARFLALSETM